MELTEIYFQSGTRIEFIPLIGVCFLLLMIFISTMLDMKVQSNIPVDLSKLLQHQTQIKKNIPDVKPLVFMLAYPYGNLNDARLFLYTLRNVRYKEVPFSTNKDTK